MKRLPLIFLSTLLFASCSRTPDNVLSKGDMADLLVDLQLATAVANQNPEKYPTDSMKQLLKQSVFEKHHITEAEFDTSLMWYGHNLDTYTEVYDDVIAQLQKREQKAVEESRKAGEQATLAGDSVDIWTLPHRQIFNKRQIGQYAMLAFSIPADDNTKAGDRYEWNMRLYNGSEAAEAVLGVDYAGGGSEYQVRTVPMDERTRIILQSDSTKKVIRVFGHMVYNLKRDNTLFADSLSLYRTRMDDEQYNNHGFQRTIKR